MRAARQIRGLYSPFSAEYSATVRSEADAEHMAQFLVNHRDKVGGNTLFLIMQSMACIGWLREVGTNKGSAAGFCSEIERWVAC